MQSSHNNQAIHAHTNIHILYTTADTADVLPHKRATTPCLTTDYFVWIESDCFISEKRYRNFTFDHCYVSIFSWPTFILSNTYTLMIN